MLSSKKTHNNKMHKKWAELRSRIKSEVRASHTKYVNGMIGDIKHDTKPFWSRYINGQKRTIMVSPLLRPMTN